LPTNLAIDDRLLEEARCGEDLADDSGTPSGTAPDSSFRAHRKQLQQIEQPPVVQDVRLARARATGSSS
jgi:hypothetical protein